MIATTDPSDMTPEERRAEVAAILAAGYMRLARRPRPPHSSLQDSAQVAATLDGKPLINWRGPPSALSVPETWGGTKLGCLALGAWGSSVALQVGVIGRRTELVLIPSGQGCMQVVSPHELPVGDV
jgi:hypothetical protein